jgi:hypothetical protein
MGHSNAAASVAALVYSRKFDLRKTYFLVSGIAGIDPAQGTLGSAAWARYLVDFGIQWELDAREIPTGWKAGYLGINTKSETEKPPLDYRTEVFQLNEALLQKAYALSRNVTLSDSAAAKAYRASYSNAPANQPPAVIQCDTLAGDTWFSGNALGQRARDWTTLLTDGMIRCYMGADKVVGFGHQFIKALMPPPPEGPDSDAAQPGPRIMHPASAEPFQALRAKMENEWMPQMMDVLNIDSDSLPIIWDADFLYGPRTEAGRDTFVLCEINVSSVFAIPDQAPAAIARLVKERTRAKFPSK